MERITLDTNVISDALKHGSDFMHKVQQGKYEIYVAETTLTLDGLLMHGKIDLLALKDVRHAFKKSRWDDYVNSGLSFLLCPRVGLPRPKFTNEDDDLIEYTLYHKSSEHTFSQDERLSRYFDLLRYIQDKLGAGQKWLSELESEIVNVGGSYNIEEPWYINLANNITHIGENKFKKRFGDWADADAVASHYAYGNDIFCTNDNAKGAGGTSVLSATNKENIGKKYGVVFKALSDL